MNQEEINKQRGCSHLLPSPGGEVVRSLLDEIEAMQKGSSEGTKKFCQVVDIEFGKAFIKPDVPEQVYVRIDPHGKDIVQCIQALPSIDIVCLPGDLCVRRINLDIKWSYPE
jgi:hypothetical protein